MKRWADVPLALLGAIAGSVLTKKLWLEKYRQQKAELNCMEHERDLFYTWLLLEQKRVQLEEFFAAKGYKTAAILGMGYMGRHLFNALQESKKISVLYGVEIDNFAAVHETLTVYRLANDPLPLADCLVICDLTWTSEKSAAVQKEFSGTIVTLSHILSWLLEQHRIEARDGAIRDWAAQNI